VLHPCAWPGPSELLAAAVLAIGLVSGPAGAAPLRTFYVDPTGNDSAAGSATQPWRTLQKAANTVRAGDLVIVRAGHYAGLYLTTSGTAIDPIAFHGEPGAIVDTQNPTTQDGINLEGASYVVIEGFTVTGVPRAGIRSVVNHHVIIRGNTGDLNGRWGILTGFSDDILIENNVMSRSQAEHGIYVSNSGDRPVIRRNVVFGNRANGIHMNGDVSQGGDGIISGALVEANTIYDNGLGGGSGINCDGVQSSVFRNNLLYGNHASGISLYQIDAAQPARDNQVLNNTIVMATDARWAINIQNASTGNVLRNNILFNQQSFRGSVAISADSLSGFVSDTNVVMDRFSVDGGDTRIGLAAWRAATGQDQSSLIATPAALFVSFAGNDYHLSATSPARDAGVTLAAVLDDLEGAPRPQGPASDIGAYEFPIAAGPVQLTVTRAGTGTVTSTPGGIDCGSSCAASFASGTSVSLTATPAAGWVFMGWSGGGCTGTSPCTVSPVSATTVTATFAPATIALTVTVTGAATGTVTSAPAGLSCSTACTVNFAAGTSVTLSAAPAAGAVFAGWSGACTGSGSCTVVLDQARAVTARFSRVFSDSTLTPLASVIRALHVTELRTAIDTLRTRQGLAAFGWTDSAIITGATVIKRSHLVEMRSAVAAVYTARGLAAPAWTDATITPGVTIVRAVHIAELRAAVLALE